MFDIKSILLSFMPEDFSMDDYIAKFDDLLSAAKTIAGGVIRIEQKLDSEIVTLRERMVALECSAGIVQPNIGVSNDHGSLSDGEGTGRSNSGSGIDADR